MKRRSLLQKLALGGAGLSAGFRIPLLHAMAAEYTGKFFVFVQAEGGWDPTSFCDPKVNQPGEADINHWSDEADPGTAGNLAFAPFGSNAAFFNKYFARTLVINGVDAQTNSHTAGVIHNWSGRISEGYPSLGALVSGIYAPALPITYLNFGGFTSTAGISRYTRLDDPQLVLNITYPNRNGADANDVHMDESDWERIQRFRGMRMADLLDEQHAMPRARRNRDFFDSAMSSIDGLRDFAELIPPEDQIERAENPPGGGFSSLRSQAQLAVLAFRAGVSMSADMFISGFDTHDNHDQRHEPQMRFLADGVDYLWDYAEINGVADRMVVMIASDFGRTNQYNDGDGKDHWPISSVVVMEKGAPWGNRVVGQTDECHNALPMIPATRSVAPLNARQPFENTCSPRRSDHPDATNIYPKHVHAALRDYFGVTSHEVTSPFPLGPVEFDFFGSA